MSENRACEPGSLPGAVGGPPLVLGPALAPGGLTAAQWEARRLALRQARDEAVHAAAAFGSLRFEREGEGGPGGSGRKVLRAEIRDGALLGIEVVAGGTSCGLHLGPDGARDLIRWLAARYPPEEPAS